MILARSVKSTSELCKPRLLTVEPKGCRDMSLISVERLVVRVARKVEWGDGGRRSGRILA